jgi:hypothetical protein
MASVYASCPDAHPALHTRMGSSGPRSASIRGMTSAAMKSHASGSRKNAVTLMRMVLNSAANSSELACSTSRYSSKVL